MRHLTIGSVAALALALLAFATSSALADDKKDEKDGSALSGAWARKEGDLKLQFGDKKSLTIYPHGDKAMFGVVCEYTVDKEGAVTAKLTELQGSDDIKEKAKGALPIGLKFTFKWKAKDNSASLSDLQGENMELLRSHLEGDYEKKD
jgi:hypothetical protein